jgi:hypothetical protein
MSVEYVLAEVIDCAALAERWKVSEQWIRSHCQPSKTSDPIPCLRLGHKTVRFAWGPKLFEWLERHQQGMDGGSKQKGEKTK